MFGCRKYYLHDLCLPLLAHPRYYDERASKDENDSDKSCKQTFLKYLEASIHILSFLGEYSKMSDFSDLLEKSIEVFKSEKKDAMLDLIKGGDGYQESTVPLIANTISAFASMEEKEFRHVEKQANKYKIEGLGNSDRLVNLITGKNSDAEWNQEMKKFHNKLCVFVSAPSEELRNEIQSSHFAQMFGVTPILLQRIFFRPLKVKAEHLRTVYLNYKARKMFTGDNISLGELNNFLRKACHV